MATDVFGQLALGRNQNPYFAKLLEQGLDTSPIQSPYQGASRMAMALLAGLEQRDEDQKNKAATDQLMNLPGLPGANSSVVQALAGAPPTASMPTPEPMGSPAMPRATPMAPPMAPPQMGGPPPSPNVSFSPPPATNPDPRIRGLQMIANGQGTPTYPGVSPFAAVPQNAYAEFKAQEAAPRPQPPPAAPQPVPPMPAAPPQMAQAQQAPQVVPQPNAGAQQPMRSPIQIEPAMAAQIQTLLRNPLTRSEGLQLYAQYAKPREETRPLVNPQDRARYGIQPTDSNPYQIDSKGEVKPINPQPFNVNVNQQGQSEFEKHYGEGMAKEALGTVANGDKAVENIQQVQLVRGLLNDIKTGKLTPGQATIGAWMQSVGVDPKVVGIDPNLPATAEAAHALMSKMALSNIGGAGGIPANNFSEADRKFIVNMTSSLSNRPEANEILLDAKERVSQLAMQKADAWSQARDAGTSYEKFNSQWRREMSSKNVFGDLIAKADALKAVNNPASAQSQPGGVRRYNPATGRIE